MLLSHFIWQFIFIITIYTIFELDIPISNLCVHLIVHSEAIQKHPTQPAVPTNMEMSVVKKKPSRGTGCRDDIDFCSEIKNVCTNPRLIEIRNTGCREFCHLCTGTSLSMRIGAIISTGTSGKPLNV